MSWNGYPKYVVNKVIKNLVERYKDNVVQNDSVNSDEDDLSQVFVRLPYCGPTGERLVRKCISRISRQLSKKVRFKILYKTNKISDFVSVKDPIPKGQNNNVIYQIQCPGCQKFYIGKTACCAEKRMYEHAEKIDQPMFQHFEKCSEFQQTVGLFALPDVDTSAEPICPKNHYASAVLNNYKVLKTVHNGALLALSETFFIRKNNPHINDGLKACVDFHVFDF